MDKILKLLKNKEKTIIAIIGATDNEEKYGFIVFKNLKDKGYNVFPLNLEEKVILGQQSYSSLSLLPKKPDIIVLIIPPKAGIEVMLEAKKLDLDNLWFQPGASDKDSDLKAKDLGFNFISKECIMKITDKI